MLALSLPRNVARSAVKAFVAVLMLAGAATPSMARPSTPLIAEMPLPLPKTLDALKRHFPEDHAALASSIEGKAWPETGSVVRRGLRAFLYARRENIASVPPATLVDLLVGNAALHRTLRKEISVKMCAMAGGDGPFSPLVPPLLSGLDEFGVALIDAARTPAAATAPVAPATPDLLRWAMEVEKIDPEAQFGRMYIDPAFRAGATEDQLCRAGAAMQEAVATMPARHAEPIARMLIMQMVTPAP